MARARITVHGHVGEFHGRNHSPRTSSLETSTPVGGGVCRCRAQASDDDLCHPRRQTAYRCRSGRFPDSGSAVGVTCPRVSRHLGVRGKEDLDEGVRRRVHHLQEQTGCCRNLSIIRSIRVIFGAFAYLLRPEIKHTNELPKPKRPHGAMEQASKGTHAYLCHARARTHTDKRSHTRAHTRTHIRTRTRTQILLCEQPPPTTTHNNNRNNSTNNTTTTNNNTQQ